MKKFLILFLASTLISCECEPEMKDIINYVSDTECDTVYVDREIDSAEVAVGYLRTNGAFND